MGRLPSLHLQQFLSGVCPRHVTMNDKYLMRLWLICESARESSEGSSEESSEESSGGSSEGSCQVDEDEDEEQPEGLGMEDVGMKKCYMSHSNCC
jgi:hypothetical protein